MCFGMSTTFWCGSQINVLDLGNGDERGCEHVVGLAVCAVTNPRAKGLTGYTAFDLGDRNGIEADDAAYLAGFEGQLSIGIFGYALETAQLPVGHDADVVALPGRFPIARAAVRATIANDSVLRVHLQVHLRDVLMAGLVSVLAHSSNLSKTFHCVNGFLQVSSGRGALSPGLASRASW